MFGSHLTVAVDKGCTFSAAEYLSLLLGEELVAVSTLIKVILVLLKE